MNNIKDFIISTNKAEYIAEQQIKKGIWILKIKFHNGIEATFIFKDFANTAVAQYIFSIDKCVL